MRSRVVIFNSLLNSVLLIHRKKSNRDYWVIPGGGKKGEESPIQTAIREVTEELQIKFKSSELTRIFDINDGEKQSVFLAVSKVVNTPQISGEELRRSSEENVYIPTWVNLESLVKINLQPVEASNKLMNFLYREEFVRAGKWLKGETEEGIFPRK